MREKLIQILHTERGRIPESVADEILKQLRCANCKHWEVESQMRDSDAKYCPRITGDDSGMIWVGGSGNFTGPDFFCALFEEKQ